MSLSLRVLIGLVAGFVVGALLAASGDHRVRDLALVVEPIGQIFFNLLRMTVVPLVVSLLVVGVASAPDPRVIGRLGWRTAVIFLVTLLAVSAFAAMITTPLLAVLPLDAGATAALRGSTPAAPAVLAEGARRVPTAGQWLVDLVPPNPVRAAADGAMLPLLVFVILFGLALGHIPAARRAPVLAFFEGVGEASMTLVRWVLAVAPIGVFALAVPLAARVGLAAAGALAWFIGVIAAGCMATVVALFAAASVLGRMAPGPLVRASLPALGVALGARSSMGALPAMIEGARRLGYPERIASFFLPLSATMFRAGGAVYYPVAALFVSRLYDVPLGPAALATVVVTGALTTLAIPAIPGGTLVVMIPVFDAAGLPVEATALLLGVDTVPDMFRTVANVAGHMSGATLLRRAAEEPGTTAAA